MFNKSVLFAAFGVFSAITAMTGHSAFADNERGEFYCRATGFRTTPENLEPIDSTFFVHFSGKSTDPVESYQVEVAGHVQIGRLQDRPYYSSFGQQDLRINPNYRPRVYTDSVQIPGVREAGSSKKDGGGMSGQFVIAKHRTGNFAAHFIFQSGDHLGGTLDYNCRPTWDK